MSSDTYRIRVTSVEGADVELEIKPTTAADLCALPGTRSIVMMLLAELGEPGLYPDVMKQDWVEKHADDYVVETTVTKVVGCVSENQLRYHVKEECVPIEYLQPRTTLRATMKSTELADRFAGAGPFGTTAWDTWWKDPHSFDTLDGKKRKVSQRGIPESTPHTMPGVYDQEPDPMGRITQLLATRLVGWTAEPPVPAAAEETPAKGKKKNPLTWPPMQSYLMKNPIGDKPVGAGAGDCSFVLAGDVASLRVSLRATTIGLRQALLIATEVLLPKVPQILSAAVDAGIASLEAAPGPVAKKKPYMKFFTRDAAAIAEAGSAIANGWLSDPAAPADGYSGCRWFPRWAGNPDDEKLETLESMADRLAALLSQPAVAHMLTPGGIATLTETSTDLTMQYFKFEGFVRLTEAALAPELDAFRWSPDHPGRPATRIAVLAALGHHALAQEAGEQIGWYRANQPGYRSFLKSIGMIEV